MWAKCKRNEKALPSDCIFASAATQRKPPASPKFLRNGQKLSFHSLLLKGKLQKLWNRTAVAIT